MGKRTVGHALTQAAWGNRWGDLIGSIVDDIENGATTDTLVYNKDMDLNYLPNFAGCIYVKMAYDMVWTWARDNTGSLHRCVTVVCGISHHCDLVFPCRVYRLYYTDPRWYLRSDLLLECDIFISLFEPFRPTHDTQSMCDSEWSRSLTRSTSPEFMEKKKIRISHALQSNVHRLLLGELSIIRPLQTAWTPWLWVSHKIGHHWRKCHTTKKQDSQLLLGFSPWSLSVCDAHLKPNSWRCNILTENPLEGNRADTGQLRGYGGESNLLSLRGLSWVRRCNIG